MPAHKSNTKILFVVFWRLTNKMPCKRVYMPHAPCRPLPFHGNLAQRYKLSCKIITSNLATWMHGILPDLWRGNMGKWEHGMRAIMESLMQVSCDKSITRWVRIFKIHMIHTCTIYTTYINTLISFHHTKRHKLLFACNRTTLPRRKLECQCLCTCARH